MKHKFFVSLVVLALLVGSVGIVSAQGPSGTYGSGIACANLGTAPATLQVNFYNQDGTVALSYSDPTTVAVGGSRNYFTPSTPAGLPSPFNGSAVVSSDQPLACTVNTQVVTPGVGTTTTPARADTSAGVDSSRASTSLYAPQVMKALAGTYNSYISVQNTTSSALTAYVSYVDRTGVAYPTARESFTLQPQSNHIFYQASNANLPAGFLGGATITSTGNLAAVAAFYNNGASYTTAQLNTYTAFASGAQRLFIPRFVRNYYGYNGGLSVQNIGSSATAITITFTFQGTTYVVPNVAINAGATYSPYATSITQLAPVDALSVGSRVGSAVVDAAPGGSIVAIVNEDNRGTCNAASCPAIPANQVGVANTYTAFGDGSQTNNIFFTQVPRNVGGSALSISGGFQVANTTGTAGTCSITYAGVSAANETNVALAANGSFSRFAPNVVSLTDGFNSSVTVQCTQAVIGISNFSARGVNYYGDSFVAADGVNQ
jgi:hypothetical protein